MFVDKGHQRVRLMCAEVNQRMTHRYLSKAKVRKPHMCTFTVNPRRVGGETNLILTKFPAIQGE